MIREAWEDFADAEKYDSTYDGIEIPYEREDDKTKLDRTEKLEKELTRSLVEFITKKNNENGNTDLKIENIRFWDVDNAIYAYADVSFTWYLNGWEKPTVLKDTIFLYRNEEWYTPTFF